MKSALRKASCIFRNFLVTFNTTEICSSKTALNETFLNFHYYPTNKYANRSLTTTAKTLAGHSKWKNIKETKSIKDNEKKKVSTAIVRKIAVAIQMEGGQTDPKLNSQLAKILEEGKNKEVAMTTMMQAIQRAKESKVARGPQAFIEAKVFVGCSMIIESFSDKQKWYKQSVQSILKRHNGRVAEAGTCKHMFDFKGVLYVNAEIDKLDYDKALELAVECNAEEVIKGYDEDEEVYKFICDPKELHEVKKALQTHSLKPYDAQLEYLPNTTVQLSNEEMELSAKLIDEILAVEGTENVFHNMVKA